MGSVRALPGACLERQFGRIRFWYSDQECFASPVRRSPLGFVAGTHRAPVSHEVFRTGRRAMTRACRVWRGHVSSVLKGRICVCVLWRFATSPSWIQPGAEMSSSGELVLPSAVLV